MSATQNIKKVKKTILILLFFLINTGASATIDYLTVNHITKQMYWADTDNSPGIIGWTLIPEGKSEFYEQEYLNRGFTFTNNPYLIEETILIALTILFIAIKINGLFRIRR